MLLFITGVTINTGTLEHEVDDERLVNPEAPLDRLVEHWDDRDVDANVTMWRAAIYVVGIFAVAFVVLMLALAMVQARNADGKYDNSPNKEFYNTLSSKHGLCCSFADGIRLEDPDWTKGKEIEGEKCILAPDDEHNQRTEGRYCVRIDGVWYLVPSKAEVDQPNKLGVAEVWPIFIEETNGINGTVVKRTLSYIRCFMPGVEG